MKRNSVIVIYWCFVYKIVLFFFDLQGHIPSSVNSTAGTTVLGSFDQFNLLADICQKYGVWLHVDVS